MRFEGTIKTWNDERGFGFIEPTQGGQEIFVHVKAFRSRSGRPQVGRRVTFEVELNPEGKKRARNVDPCRPPRVQSRPRNNIPAQWGTASLFAIPAFLVLYFVLALLWRVPAWVGAIYAGKPDCIHCLRERQVRRSRGSLESPGVHVAVSRSRRRLARRDRGSTGAPPQVQQGLFSHRLLGQRRRQCPCVRSAGVAASATDAPHMMKASSAPPTTPGPHDSSVSVAEAYRAGEAALHMALA